MTGDARLVSNQLLAHGSRSLSDFLPKASLLTLRLVCSTTKRWVDHRKPSLFSSLQLDYPLTASPSSRNTLYRLTPDCHELTVRISSASGSSSLTLPPLPCLERLNIITAAPTSSISSTLLSLRLTLQRASLPELSEIAIQHISISDVFALRWGPFSSFGDSSWTSARMWHGIKSLQISMKPWWEPIREDSGDQNRARRRNEKDARRVGIKMLHDWLASFAGTLEKLVFEWMETSGPNPLLLDIFSTRDGKGKWFSAPEINWKVLRELRLSGCLLLCKDVTTIKDRAVHLAMLMAQQHMVETGIQGTRSTIGDDAWFSVDLGSYEYRIMTLVPVCGTETEEFFEVTTHPASVESTGGDNEGVDVESVWSDDSMEVPIFLETT